MAYGDIRNPVRRDDLESLEFLDSDGSTHMYPVYGQGPHRTVITKDGEIIDPSEYNKDMVVRFTNPNLHRRVDPHDPPEPEDPNYDPSDPESINRAYLNKELKPREYELLVQGAHSHRTTKLTVHDEESITTEIP